MHKMLGRDTARTQNKRDSPYCMTLYSTIQTGVKKEEGRGVWSDDICLPKKPLCMTSPAFLEVAEHLPAKGEQRMNSLFCFACTCGFYLTK